MRLFHVYSTAVENINYQFLIRKACVFKLDFFHASFRSSSRKSNKDDAEFKNSSQHVTINPCGIQMLPRSIHKQIFKDKSSRPPTNETVGKIQKHLESHNLWGAQPDILPDVEFKLPPLQGDNIAEHFQKIAEQQSRSYKDKILNFISNDIPELPKIWNFAPGWTRYDSETGEMNSVDFPDEGSYVFDVEVCVKDGHFPTLATAASNKYWYSWCSDKLCEIQVQRSISESIGRTYELHNLINLETKRGQDRLAAKDLKDRIVIGHNVSYDRSRVKEQYFIEGTKIRFLDTMALHIAVSGITSFQRNMLLANKSNNAVDKPTKNISSQKTFRKAEGILEWQNVSSFNGLSDVHKLYCGGRGLDKEKRNIFVTGTLDDVKKDFQQLTSYCARDCIATYEVLRALFPEYQNRFPHPVTLAGMFEMSTAYLPVNENWQRYLQESEDSYRDLENELNQSLRREADRACYMMGNSAFKDDPWLWDLDWSSKSLKVKKTPTVIHPRITLFHNVGTQNEITVDSSEVRTETEDFEDTEFQQLKYQFQDLLSSKLQLYKRNSFLPGYPNWYVHLCDRGADGLEGPAEVSTSSQVVPKLLKLTWDGYPLFHSRELGWGYLVPGRPLKFGHHNGNENFNFPLEEALILFPPRTSEKPTTTQGIVTADDAMDQLKRMSDLTTDPMSLAVHWQASRQSVDLGGNDSDSSMSTQKPHCKHSSTQTFDRPSWHVGIGPYDVGIPGCWFFRLPHKLGIDSNVGNPLAKDYLNKIEDGTLKANSSSIAKHVLKLNRNIIYWRNARDRILSQMVVWLKQSQLPRRVTKSIDFDSLRRYGAILPQVITSGTLTRRAVESTWMTASNAHEDRIGSELKAMIQCPPGYCFVGADVDSQELWIASIIGDSHFAGHHGSTAFGWMTLQGKKSNATDMHSRTASAIGIRRDQAKVLNYGRIYGAGERFAKTLLMQFNHRLTENEASEKARKMYRLTKGNTVYKLNFRGQQLASALGQPSDEPVSQECLYEMRKNARKYSSLLPLAKLPLEELTERRLWVGGTESYMFNKLEEIAQSECPETPILNCRISRALEPRNVGKEFMTSRVNWVVQSSAVDYLHLMLVAVRYLCSLYKIEGRFCISIHDEVRYLIKVDDKYRAALALQIANLWTRCMFSYRMKMNDLPQSVAFFSSVDIDTVLRKEVYMDCKTPSNPYGLKQGYNVDFGSCYDIYQILEKTKGSLNPPT